MSIFDLFWFDTIFHLWLDTSPERSTYSWREGTPGQVFPSPLQNLVPLWLNSMMEYKIGQNNIPVSVYSAKIIQQCLNEDSLLFLRNLTEKVFAKNICPNESVVMLSRLLSLFNKGSAWEMHRQSKKIIANYLIGLIMTVMRACEKQQE